MCVRVCVFRYKFYAFHVHVPVLVLIKTDQIFVCLVPTQWISASTVAVLDGLSRISRIEEGLLVGSRICRRVLWPNTVPAGRERSLGRGLGAPSHWGGGVRLGSELGLQIHNVSYELIELLLTALVIEHGSMGCKAGQCVRKDVSGRRPSIQNTFDPGIFCKRHQTRTKHKKMEIRLRQIGRMSHLCLARSDRGEQREKDQRRRR